jgi:hypothetical protein
MSNNLIQNDPKRVDVRWIGVNSVEVWSTVEWVNIWIWRCGHDMKDFRCHPEFGTNPNSHEIIFVIDWFGAILAFKMFFELTHLFREGVFWGWESWCGLL